MIVLKLILYLLYTCGIPTCGNNNIATFADDAAITAVERSKKEATEKLQEVDSAKSMNGHRDGGSNCLKPSQYTKTLSVIPYWNTAKYVATTLQRNEKVSSNIRKKQSYTRKEKNLESERC